MKDYSTEVWKDVVGYEEQYSVSNFGRVLSKTTNKLRKLIVRKDGYVVLSLYKNNVGKNVYVHRLVMESFSGGNIKETINHKDGNKQNNHISNLEYMTYKENNKHAILTGLITSENRRNCKGSIKVAQYDLQGKLIKVYPSMRQAERETGIDATSIGRGVRKGWNYGGFVWKFA